ncbi:MAG TPA: glycine zipper 2TM domain-containing protein [Caulobacteraceae bacterium]|jgi:hypothetical protein|nr:glycine zipper 2TM domain-containing protein [Caulobacteraceae bacterium]
MRNLILLGSLMTALAVPMLAMPTAADASCSGRKTTGTILGGVGGALLGNSISHGGGGAVVGGLGGAVVGHEIGKGGGDCARATTAYRAPARKLHYTRQHQAYYYNSAGHRVYVR